MSERTQQNGRRAEQQSTAITKTALGDQRLAQTPETAATVLAARETAQVQARIIQALQRPRRFEEVRERFASDCARPRFAMVARFHKPQGWVTDPETNKPIVDERGQKIRNFVKGWSIRAVESATQAMGNIDCTATTIYEDDRKEIVTCKVWDLERNLTFEAQVVVEKTIERKSLRQGQTALESRPNSWGDTVYILPATEDDVRLKRNRLVSMTLRTLALRVIPSDLLDEFLEPVEQLRARAIDDEKAGVLKDPKAALRGLLDKLAAIGIRAADVVDYLGGRSVESATPDQILELRIIGADISAGNYSWREALAGSPYREPTEQAGDEEDDKAKAARARIDAKLAETKAKKAKAAPAAATSGTGTPAPEQPAAQASPEQAPPQTPDPAPAPPPPPPPSEPAMREMGED